MVPDQAAEHEATDPPAPPAGAPAARWPETMGDGGRPGPRHRQPRRDPWSITSGRTAFRRSAGTVHAVAFSGPTVAVSGQVPADREGRVVGLGDPAAQVRQVFENLTAVLAAAGATMTDVVKLTVFLTDLADLPAYRAVRDEYVSADRPPASSLVQVSGLVHPDFRVEVEALAVLGNQP
jgi:enamine deaminase RidA (YjgF/YER057c/UK114 family)